MRLLPLLAVAIASVFAASQPESWRSERRLIDLHQHINYTPEHLARAIRIMDASGIGIGVNLSGGPTLSKDGKLSDFERNKSIADKAHPGRFLHYMNLDYGRWNEPDFSSNA